MPRRAATWRKLKRMYKRKAAGGKPHDDGCQHYPDGTVKCEGGWESDTSDGAETTTTTVSDAAHNCERIASGRPHVTVRISKGEWEWRGVEGHIEVRKELGISWLGTVYLGFDRHTNQSVVIKRKDKLESEPERFDKYVRAMSDAMDALRGLHHPNLVNILNTQSDENSFSIYTEYASGGSVKALLSVEGAFSEERTRNVVLQVVRGLEYLHRHNVIHGELRCKKIFLTADNVAKISDFGVSKARPDQRNEKCRTEDDFVIAPELMKRSWHDFPLDVWLLGCCVMQMLTGEAPFKNLFQFLNKLKENRLVVPIPDGISDGAKDFIGACTRLEPAARPTAEQLLQHAWLREASGTVESACDGARE